jgi:hypothetical protein
VVNNSREFWDKVGKKWRYLKPPFRPSPAELTIYEKRITEVAKNEKNPKAVVLGATPELRDLLTKYNYSKVVLVDIDPNVVKEMSKLLQLSKGNEEVYITDWLDMYLPETFDLVLCDHGLHFIEFNKWETFFRRVKNILNDNGQFVTSIFTSPDKKRVGLKKLLSTYSKGGSQWSDEDRVYYAYRLFFYYSKDRIADLVKIENSLLEMGVSRDIITDILPPKSWEHSLSYIAQNFITKKIIRKVFYIHSIDIPVWDHPVYTFHQIYQLKKSRVLNSESK